MRSGLQGIPSLNPIPLTLHVVLGIKPHNSSNSNISDSTDGFLTSTALRNFTKLSLVTDGKIVMDFSLLSLILYWILQ